MRTVAVERAVRQVRVSPAAEALAVVGVAAVARFSELGARGFWRDEAVTVGLVRRSFGGMLDAIPHSEGTPPLYYVLAWGWTRVFGTGEAGLRSLSALAGTLTVGAVYVAGRWLFSHRAGIAAALLAAVNPFLVWHSQDGRSYALFALLGALTLLAFLRVLQQPGRRQVVVWALACVLTLWTHYFGVFLIAPEAAWLLVRHRRRPTVAAAAVIGAAGAAALPLALVQRRDASVAWIADIPRVSRARELAEQFVVGPQSPHATALSLAGGALALVGIGLLASRGSGRERRAAALVGGVGAASVVLAFCVSLAGVDYFLSRNLIVAWVPVALVAAAGFAGARSRPAGAAAVVALVAISLAVVVDTVHTPKFGGEDWRGAAQALGAARSPRAVVLWLGVGADAFSLYRPHAAPMARTGLRVGEVDVVAVGGDHGSDLDARRDHLFPPQPFRETARVDRRYFTLVRFRAPTPQHVSPGTLVSGGPGYSAAVLVDEP
jgi:mannosyltransferase